MDRIYWSEQFEPSMNPVEETIPTRHSLLSRLKDWQDQESWKVFFDTYWRLIYHAARKAGLTEAEAQDAVQETVISVMKKMPGFEYEKTGGSFKAWLLQLTSWRIVDQFRKRLQGAEQSHAESRTSTRTSTVERVPDPAGLQLEAIWNEEWEANLMEAAIERVKKRVDAKQYQLFDLYVLKEWPVSKVAETMKTSQTKVYLAKHRISRLIKKEIAHLQAKAF